MAEAGTIRVTDWNKHQHYKKSKPPWIKLYREVLTDYDVTGLEPWERWCLVGLWLIAAETDNEIPADPHWLRARLVIDKDPPLEKLQALGFIEVGDSSRESLEKPLAKDREEGRVQSTSSSSSLRSDSSDGAGSDVENSSEEETEAPDSTNPGEVYAPLIRDHLWQSNDPPANAPDERWHMGREIHVAKRLESQGHDRDELCGAIQMYRGPPITLAVWYKRGNRGGLNEHIAKWQRDESTRVSSIGEIMQKATGTDG